MGRAITLAVVLLASAATSAERPAAPPTVSLEQAVRSSLDRNPSAQIAQEEIGRAEALLRQSRAGLLPTLTANGTYTRLDDDRVFNGRVVAGANQLAGNVTLTVPIVAPERFGSYRRAQDQVELARSAHEDTRRQLALTVARAYLTALSQERVVEVQARALSTAEAHAAFARTRYEGGLGSRLDVVRSEQEREASAARVMAAKTALLRAHEALAILIGTDGPVRVEEPHLPAPAKLEDALGHVPDRADVRAADRRVSATRHSLNLGWTDYTPSLTGTFQPFFQDPPTLVLPQTGWSLLLHVGVPLYDGGLRYARRDERERLDAEAQAVSAATRRTARSEIRTALSVVEQTEASLLLIRKAASLAREGLELAEAAYRGGLSTNLELIDAERRARDAETEVELAEDQVRKARLEALSATGAFPPR